MICLLYIDDSFADHLAFSHDLALVRKVADRIVVMREGRIVEEGPASRVIARPRHAYTRSLLQAAPAFTWESGPKGFQDL